jgi:radical SAM superfamily enzyme YgiQ (UPF0313 family)
MIRPESENARKKLLLIQPENLRLNRFRRGQFNNFVQITMPYLAGFVDEAHYEITLIDEYNQKIPYNRTFDLVAMTVNTPNARHCYAISKRFRQNGAKVVMGGPHATLLPDEATMHCDYLITGEAEETWPQFLTDFSYGTARTRYAASRPPSLDHLPQPRWDLLKNRISLMKGAVFATRGCPYHCSYCNLKQIYYDRFCKRPAPEVVQEIAAMKSGHFVFWDDNFFVDKAYTLQLLEAITPLRKKWAAQVTLKDCDDELLEAAGLSGCLYLFVGLESFSSGALETVNKEINRTCDYRRIITNIHRHGIMVQAGIIFGFDTDNKDTFAETLKACERYGIDGATVSILTPLPQTPVYWQMCHEKRLLTDDWSRFDGKTAVAFRPKQMTEEELYAGYLAFRRKFYSLSSFLKRMSVSRTKWGYNLVVNLGYRLALQRKITYN